MAPAVQWKFEIEWIAHFLYTLIQIRFRTIPAANIHTPALLLKTHQWIGDTSLLTVGGYMKVGL